MLLWIAIGSALLGAVGRWRLAEARSDQRARADEARRRALRRRRGHGRITRLEPTGATLLGMPAFRIAVDVEGAVSLVLTRALTPAQLAWVKVGATLDLTYDPDDLANHATELEGRWNEELAARAVRVQLDAPLWALDHHGADAWLLPPREAPALRVVIGAFGGDGDPADVAVAAYLAADALALTTSARAAVSLIVEPATHAIAADADATAESAEVLIACADARRAVQFRRARGEAPPPLPPCAAAQLPGALAAAIVEARLATAIARPAWHRAPRAEAAHAYAEIVPGLVRQLLADPARAAIAPLSPAAHAEIVDRAVARAHAHDDGQVHLAALACAYHAARAGAMTIEQRVYASQLVRHYAGTGHPIRFCSRRASSSPSTCAPTPAPGCAPCAARPRRSAPRRPRITRGSRAASRRLPARHGPHSVRRRSRDISHDVSPVRRRARSRRIKRAGATKARSIASCWRKAGAGGFLCPWLDEAHGGAGGDFLHSVILMEELARAYESGFAMCLHSDGHHRPVPRELRQRRAEAALAARHARAGEIRHRDRDDRAGHRQRSGLRTHVARRDGDYVRR